MAIEPIKGFYVHDEETNTDGVAKYDWNAVENAPDVDAVVNGITRQEAIGCVFLQTNKGLIVWERAIGFGDSSVLDSTNVIPLPDDVIAVYMKVPVYESSTTFGVGFFSTNSMDSLVSISLFKSGGAYGSEMKFFYVPHGAKYFVTSWFHDTETYGEWEGYFLYEEVPRISEEVETLNNAVFEALEPVEITELENTAVTLGGALSWQSSYAGYKSYQFDIEPQVTYIIKGYDNEIIRCGQHPFDRETFTTLWSTDGFSLADGWELSADPHYYKFTNTNGYAYAYFMGCTPNYPNAHFEVFKVNEIPKFEPKVEIDDGVELVGKGAAFAHSGGYWDKYIKNGTFFQAKYLSDGASQVAFSLSDIEANTQANCNNIWTAINQKPAVAVIGKNEVIEVNVDVNIRNTTFTQFAISLRKPNTSTSMINFFNVSAADVPDGHFVFSQTFYFEEGTEIGVPFLYFEDSEATEYFVTGTVSIVKKKQILDSLEVDGKTYFLDNSVDVDLTRGYAKTTGKLHKNGKYIVDANEVPVELRGYGLHGLLQYNNLHGRKPLECLRNYGVNMIRISVYLEDYIFNDSDGEIAYGYLSHPDETKAEIERIIKNCIDLGLYILLDWHVFSYQTGIVNHAAYTGTDVLHETEAVEFFTYFTQKYGDCPNMLWEIANEPHNLTPAQLAPFVQTIRDIIVANVSDPVMVCGNTGYGDTAAICQQLYDELADNYDITDVFISPHAYPPETGFLNAMKAMHNADFPVFSTEWGNSSSSGSGGSDDTKTNAFLDYMHEVGLPQAAWKFTDQTYLCSVLKNQGIINSEKWLDGFGPTDISQNGTVVLNRWASYVRNKWIEREAVT